MPGWDKGLDFENMYMLLVRKLKSRRLKTRCYSTVLLIQLRNGSRLSEAIRAFKEYLRSGKNEVEIPISKKKRVETRLMVIPEEVKPTAKQCVELITVEDKKLVDRIKNWVQKTLKINTHSLRYSFVTYLLKQGVNPTIIAKITKHTKLDYILTYTQEKQAEKILRDIDIV